MKSETQRLELHNELSRCRTVATVSQDGELLGHLTGLENINLPVLYHAIKGEHLAPYTSALFYRYGLIGERELRLLLVKLPGQMTAYEKRLTGFMRAMFVEPEMIVYDGIYDGLARMEIELVAKFDEFFHLHFPFRTSVLLSFENFSHPAGSHRQVIYLDDAQT